MSKILTLSHPDTELNPRTFLAFDVQPGDQNLKVKNTQGFAVGDYVRLGKYGQESAEIVPIISAVTLSDTIVVGAPRFGHPADTEITRMDFNQFKIYRSQTGIGGFYTLVDTQQLMVDQFENVYHDRSAIAPFSYRFTYYNDATMTETDFGPEVPFSGMPFYSLGELTRRVLSLYGDKNNEYISRDDVRDWLNECMERMSFEILGGDSPFNLVSVVIPLQDNVSEYDLSQYGVVEVLMVEFSHNNLDYQALGAADIRNGGHVSNSFASYSFYGNKLVLRQVGPKGYVKVWYAANPSLLQEDTDYLPLPFQAHTRIFVDWALQRCHEYNRDIDGMTRVYITKLKEERDQVIARLRSRLKANKSMATPFGDSLTGDYYL